MHVPQIFNWFDFKVLSASFPNGLSDTDSHGFFLGSQPHAVSADLPCMRGHPPPFSSNKLLLMFKYVISMYFFPRSLYFCINPLNMLCGCQLIFGCMWSKSIHLSDSLDHVGCPSLLSYRSGQLTCHHFLLIFVYQLTPQLLLPTAFSSINVTRNSILFL
jgi:hypothetical protein